LSPNAAAELTPIAWKRSEIPSLQPRLKNLPVEPMAENKYVSGNTNIQSEVKPAQEPSNKPASSKLVLQPMSSLPAIASASLEPMMAGPDDIPALRDVNPSLPSLSSPSAVSPAVFQPVDEQGMNAGNLGTQGNATDSADMTATAKKSGKVKAEKPPRPVVYYTPLPAIAVFPVLKHGTNVMFSDVPVVFAKELSRRLELQAPGTQVLNPYYTVESMQAKGIDHLYQKMMKEYRFAGRPDPVTLDYLLKQLTANSDRPISRVFFVEADLDTNEPMSPKGPGGVVDRVRNVFDGSTPDFMKYYVRSHVQVYDTENPNMPQVWNFDWKYPVRAERFNNVTTSVFSDSDSLRAFNETSGMLSKAALLVLPKSVYMDEHVDSSVQGYLAGRGNAQDPQSQLEPGMHPISTATPESGETDENNIGLRARSGRPKRPVTESTRQVINQVNKWLY
jgi:hypothetical protein